MTQPQAYSTRVMFLSTEEQISKLIKLGTDREDPRILVEHQLDSPLDFALVTIRLSDSNQKKTNDSLAEATRAGINTFRDLFTSPSPPLELLKLAQKYFKQKLGQRQVSVEQQAFYLFYLLSILVARIRCRANISRLSEIEQLRAAEALERRPWVDQDLKRLLAEARKSILLNR
jgi:hypothetical protein